MRRCNPLQRTLFQRLAGTTSCRTGCLGNIRVHCDALFSTLVSGGVPGGTSALVAVLQVVRELQVGYVFCSVAPQARGDEVRRGVDHAGRYARGEVRAGRDVVDLHHDVRRAAVLAGEEVAGGDAEREGGT